MKDTDAAQVLSALAQSHEVPAGLRRDLEDAAKANRQQQMQQQHVFSTSSNGNGQYAQPGEPGPSSHPRGPPTLYDPHAIQQTQNVSHHHHGHSQDGHSGDDGDENDNDDEPKTPGGGSKRGRSATMGTEEWTRQRKDNHVRYFIFVY